MMVVGSKYKFMLLTMDKEMDKETNSDQFSWSCQRDAIALSLGINLTQLVLKPNITYLFTNEVNGCHWVSPFGDPTFSDSTISDPSNPTLSDLTLKRVVSLVFLF